ncbi:MAG: hypothetical protein Q8L11_05020 [Candidatus Moranbacteria bacterium]|nr:hypothetical protein [Candidatus Moranbacteria bacterium]
MMKGVFEKNPAIGGAFDGLLDPPGKDLGALASGSQIEGSDGTLLARIMNNESSSNGRGQISIKAEQNNDESIQTSHTVEAEKIRSAEYQKMIEKVLDEIDLFSQRVAAFEERIKINEQLPNPIEAEFLSTEFAELSREMYMFLKSLNLDEIRDTKIRPAFNALVDQLFALKDHVAEEVEKEAE